MSDENKKNLLGIRSWINPDTTAFVYAHLENDNGWLYGTVKIADCRRSITLDLEVNSKKDRKKSRKKLEKLIHVLHKTLEAVEKLDE